jgi:hypothetical protein
MAHAVDGFKLKFTSRTSWKAERRQQGRLIDVVPVTWTKDYRVLENGILLDVHFKKSAEAQEFNSLSDPFVVAVAKAKDDRQTPPEFDFFTSLFRVLATGQILSEHTIETRVLERLRAS